MPYSRCRPEPALARPKITQRPELWICWSDFNVALPTGYCYGLVVHLKVWKKRSPLHGF